MTEAYDLTEEIYDLLSGAEELKNMIFVKAYTKEKPPRPITTTFCAVGLKSSEFQSDGTARQIMEITVYSDLRKGGEGCIETMGIIGEYLLSQKNGVISITVGGVEYNSYTVSFVSQLFVTYDLNTFSRLKNSDYIGTKYIGVPIELDWDAFYAEYGSVKTLFDYHHSGEVWNNEGYYVNTGLSYVIEIGGFEYKWAEYLAGLSDFNLGFNICEQYYGCRVIQVEYDRNKNRVSKVIINASGRREI